MIGAIDTAYNDFWQPNPGDSKPVDPVALQEAMDKLWREMSPHPSPSYIVCSRGTLRIWGRAASMTRFIMASAENLVNWGIPEREWSGHGFGDGERQFYTFDKRRLKRLRRKYARK